MDTTLTSINILGMKVSGLSVLALTPEHLILTLIVIIFGAILFRLSKNIKVITKKKTNCSTCFEIIRIHDDTHSRKVFSLQSSILKEQIEYAELILSTIKTKIIDVYRKQLDSVGIDPQRHKDEMDMYSAFIEVQHNRAVDWVRLRLKANHLEEKTEEEFAEYTKEVVSKMISDTRMNMLSHWNTFFSVPLSENKNRIDDMQVDLYNDIRAIFSHAQKVAKEKRLLIKQADEEYDNEMSNLLYKAKTGNL